MIRKTFLLLGLLVLALPVAGVAALGAGEGTLSVEDGQGKVTLQARGGVIGRLDRGSVTIYDLKLRWSTSELANCFEHPATSHAGDHRSGDHLRPDPEG